MRMIKMIVISGLFISLGVQAIDMGGLSLNKAIRHAQCAFRPGKYGCTKEERRAGISWSKKAAAATVVFVAGLVGITLGVKYRKKAFKPRPDKTPPTAQGQQAPEPIPSKKIPVVLLIQYEQNNQKLEKTEPIMVDQAEWQGLITNQIASAQDAPSVKEAIEKILNPIFIQPQEVNQYNVRFIQSPIPIYGDLFDGENRYIFYKKP